MRSNNRRNLGRTGQQVLSKPNLNLRQRFLLHLFIKAFQPKIKQVKLKAFFFQKKSQNRLYGFLNRGQRKVNNPKLNLLEPYKATCKLWTLDSAKKRNSSFSAQNRPYTKETRSSTTQGCPTAQRPPWPEQGKSKRKKFLEEISSLSCLAPKQKKCQLRTSGTLTFLTRKRRRKADRFWTGFLKR